MRDGIHSIYEKGDDVELAAARFAASVLRNRARYGNLGYVPTGGWPDHCRRRAEA